MISCVTKDLCQLHQLKNEIEMNQPKKKNLQQLKQDRFFAMMTTELRAIAIKKNRLFCISLFGNGKLSEVMLFKGKLSSLKTNKKNE